MLDLFVIFTRGGIVLWSLVDPGQSGGDLRPAANDFISQVLLEGKGGGKGFSHQTLSLHHKLDNELNLVFLAGHQAILKLPYIEALLDKVQEGFKEKFGSRLRNESVESILNHEFAFSRDFIAITKRVEAEAEAQKKAGKAMRSYKESAKAAAKESLVIDTSKKNNLLQSENNHTKPAQQAAPQANGRMTKAKIDDEDVVPNGLSAFKQDVSNKENQVYEMNSGSGPSSEAELSASDVDILQAREALKKKAGGKGGKASKNGAAANQKKGKQQRTWDASFGGGASEKAAALLDYSAAHGGSQPLKQTGAMDGEHYAGTGAVGSMAGALRSLEVEEEVPVEEEIVSDANDTKKPSKKSGGGMFSIFRGLVGSKVVTKELSASALEKLKDHMIAKNVAADIAAKLCESVAEKIEGKVLGTFESLTTLVKSSLQEALVQILSPKRRVDILRDIIEAKRQNRPYVFTFCGVNGVGKSTNLAKICFWLIENNFRVLIGACDTFRAGAVEQLRTHTRALNSLHPPEKHDGLQMVQLYEKGYGKDAATIAMEAIRLARDQHVDVVLVDTAGRMQDNEPLMRALAKLIKVNEPDLVLFVGEALVGNEAVDQLTKFNQALADYSGSQNPHVIDGIVLTKFDAIDDKVGAAISMSYITGQPIMFVGTGQSYADLRALDAKSVITTLMK